MATPKSRRTVWILVAVIGAVVLCVCLIVVLGLGTFVITGQRMAVEATRTAGEEPPLPPGMSPAVAICTWQALPDLPRQINSVVVDPTNPKIMYAGTGLYGSGGGGLYKSQDAGLTWKLMVKGLPDDIVNTLSISQDASVLYAIIGPDGDIYASTNGATSWEKAGVNQELCCNVPHQMVVLPGDAKTLFIVQPAADENLSYSRDGGQTWQRIQDERGTLKAGALAIDSTNVQVMYLGTGGHGVYKSTDGGMTWTAANRGMVDYRIIALAIDPANPQTIYAGADSGELFKSADGAQTWNNISDKLPLPDYARMEVANIVVSPAAVYVTNGQNLLMSHDSGETWSRVKGPAQDKPMIRFTKVVVTSDPQPTLVVGVEDSGGWRCTP